MLRKQSLEHGGEGEFTIDHNRSLDIIGLLPTSSCDKIYIMSSLKYVSDWPKVQATHSVTSKEMENFVFEQIVC